MLTLFLCGDVMTGRGIDQALPWPGDPRLREPHLRDARDYLRLAGRANGAVDLPVPFSWPWGAALRAIDDVRPDARVLNLETAVTERGEFMPGKAVHYRMSPRNLPAVLAGEPDVCVLANNHVLDFGADGLADTLDALTTAGVHVAGAGRDEAEASASAVVGLPEGHRLVVHAAAARSSGVPGTWAAAGGTPGVHYLPDLSDATATAIAERVSETKRAGDVVVFSVHWGSNWGYRIPGEQVRFAHRLVDAGVDVVHGHSSHHPRPFEVYRDRLILYGCGDLINDYEGIPGFEEYRDLRLLYFPSLDPATGALAELRMLPVRARRLRLQQAPAEDALWLRDTLNRVGEPFGTRLTDDADGMLTVRHL